MSRAERRRLERENLKVLSEHKKRQEFAEKFMKEFTPAQILKIHKYAEILKEIEIREASNVIEKFSNVVMSNAIQGALAGLTDLDTSKYHEILKAIREYGIEDAAAITKKTKSDGKAGQITVYQGMEEFYMAIEKKDVQMINKAKELLQQKYNQKRVIELLKKEFSVPTGAANIAFRKAKEMLLKEAVKEVAKEVTESKIEPVTVIKTETVKEKVIKYLNSKVDEIQNKQKNDIIKDIKKTFKITDSTAESYYYAWKKQYIVPANPIKEPVASANTNKKVEGNGEVKKMKELSIVEQLKEKLEGYSNERVTLNAAISEIKTKLEEVEKSEKAIKTAVNALEGVIL